jgi:hypothetical protein
VHEYGPLQPITLSAHMSNRPLEPITPTARMSAGHRRVVGVKILQHGQAFIDIDPVTPQDLPLARTVAPVPATATRLARTGE